MPVSALAVYPPGQKQQLLWDLPPAETFELNRALYDVPRASYRETVAELTQLLELAGLLTKPTRQLSLGERMKCELAASLSHRPRVLFLDEPTIGLDVTMQATIRNFIKRYNERSGATILLTSHYMDDVAALCPRVIVIDRGTLSYDGGLDELVRTVRPEKRLVLHLEQPVARADLERLGRVVSHSDAEAVLQLGQRRRSPPRSRGRSPRFRSRTSRSRTRRSRRTGQGAMPVRARPMDRLTIYADGRQYTYLVKRVIPGDPPIYEIISEDAMRAKFPYELAPGVYGELTIALEVPESVRLALEAKGYGEQEIENLVGQVYQELLTVVGLDDAHGI